jgi:phosphatidylglycerophosphate synthase
MDHEILVTKTVIMLASLLALLALLFNRTVLSLLSKIEFENGFRPFSPNWITLYRLILTCVGFLLYIRDGDYVLWGITLVAFGAALDRVDGKMANVVGRYLSNPSTWRRDPNNRIYAVITQADSSPEYHVGNYHGRFSEFWIEFNFSGGTDFGKVFDALIDKFQVLVFLVYFALLPKIFSIWLVAGLYLPETFGTMMRRPFTFLNSYVHQQKASGVGKIKAVAIWVVIAISVPIHQGWIDNDHWAKGLEWTPKALLSISIVLALFSVMSRLKFFRRNKRINNVVEEVEGAIKH